MLVRHGRNTWHRLKGHDSVEGYFRRRTFDRSVRALVGRRHAGFYEQLMERSAAAV
jgi:hypothetical protein